MGASLSLSLNLNRRSRVGHKRRAPVGHALRVGDKLGEPGRDSQGGGTGHAYQNVPEPESEPSSKSGKGSKGSKSGGEPSGKSGKGSGSGSGSGSLIGNKKEISNFFIVLFL